MLDYVAFLVLTGVMTIVRMRQKTIVVLMGMMDLMVAMKMKMKIKMKMMKGKQLEMHWWIE
jgi:hypothetical protein